MFLFLLGGFVAVGLGLAHANTKRKPEPKPDGVIAAPAKDTIAGSSMTVGAAAATKVGGQMFTRRIHVMPQHARPQLTRGALISAAARDAARAVAQVAAADLRPATVAPSPAPTALRVNGVGQCPVPGTLPTTGQPGCGCPPGGK